MAGIIIGIDEVGRGPLAGPVMVAAFLINGNFKVKKLNVPLRDSKKLSFRQRETWFEELKKNKDLYAVASVSAGVIDRINVTAAANLAATRALKRLLNKHERIAGRVKIFLDGGLYLNTKNLQLTNYKLQPKTIVRGDEKIKAVKIASIIAKVTRDRLMLRMHKNYPNYGFDEHKGYGTKKHMNVIKRHGPSPIHRLTFIH